MAEILILEIGSKHKLAHRGFEVSGVDDLDVQFHGDRDFIIDQVVFEKPSTSVLTTSLVMVSQGVTVESRLCTIDASKSVIDGIDLEQSLASVPVGSYVKVVSTGAVAGVKKVVLVGRRIDA